MNEIELYALDVVLHGAQSSLDDDIDEEGELASEEDWLVALSVAQRIVNWIDGNAEFILDSINRANDEG